MASSQFNSKQDQQIPIEQIPIEVKAEIKDEAMPVYLPPGVANVITKLLNGNILFNVPFNQATTPYVLEKRKQFRLFDKPIENLLTEKIINPDPEAAVIGGLILRGEEKDVVEAIELIKLKLKNDPHYLDYAVVAADPLGRKVKGTLLQIAAMAGDVDLKTEIKEEKNRGLVEQIAKVGGLSQEDIALQLQVITSPEAMAANEKRNQQIIDAVKKFGEGIINKQKEYKGKDTDFKAFQDLCKPVIADFEKALTIEKNDVMTLGFIFDTAILYHTTKWFEDNVDRFGGWWSLQSDVFWVNGIGKLQAKLSSRDAQVISAGIGYFVEEGQMPGRTLKHSSGVSYFFNSSGLGLDFYLGYYGIRGAVAGLCGRGRFAVAASENLCRSKTTALQSLCNAWSHQSRAARSL